MSSGFEYPEKAAAIQEEMMCHKHWMLDHGSLVLTW